MIKLNYPNLLSFHRNTSMIYKVKEDLDRVSTEAVTGQRADITEAAGGDIGGMHLVKKALDDIERSDRITNIVGSRLDLIGQALGSAREAVSGVDTTAIIALAAEGNMGIEAVSDDARSAVQKIMASLNVRHGARNLFSGDKIDTAPFIGSTETLLADIDNIVATAGTPADIQAALDFYFDDPAGGFQTNIYQGSDRSADSVRLSSGEVINVGIRGDDPAIKSALRGLSVLAAATQAGLDYSSTEFSEIFNQGISAAGDGSSALLDLESSIGIEQSVLSSVQSRNTFEALTLSEIYQNVVGRDQFEAAAELKNLETQLESAFVITARMANLNLVNFLR